MLCQECKKRDTCTKLCEKANNWVNKDHVSQRELPCTEFTLEYLDSLSPVKWQAMASYYKVESLEFPFLSDLQNKCLHLFYFEGFKYKQIAIRVNHKVSKVKYQLYKAKQLIRGHFSY